MVKECRWRGIPIELIWFRGHTNSLGNFAADAPSKQGTRLGAKEREQYRNANIWFGKIWPMWRNIDKTVSRRALGGYGLYMTKLGLIA